MDFQSAMETFAEAWVAANTQTPLTEAAEAQGLLLSQGTIGGSLPPQATAGSSVATLHELTAAATSDRRDGDCSEGESGRGLRSPAAPSGHTTPQDFRNSNKLQALTTSKSIPVHCLVEQGCSQSTEPTVELDSYAIVPSSTLFSDLVRTALIRLGYASSEVIGARGGAIQIKNWRPLTFDQISDQPEATVGDILGELATIATLRIRLYSRPKANAANDVKEKLLQVLLAQSQSILLSSGCPIDQPILAALSKGRLEGDISEDTRKKFDQWYLQQVFHHCRQVVLHQQQQHHQQQQQAHLVQQQEQQRAQQEQQRTQSQPSIMEVTYSTTSPPRLTTQPSHSQNRTRIRTSFDPELELPKLHQWFAENQHPSRLLIQQYVRELNSLESRRGRKPLDVNNVVYWFKNARAAYKRAEQRYAEGMNGMRSPYSETVVESQGHGVDRFDGGGHRLILGSPLHPDDESCGVNRESNSGYDQMDSGEDNGEDLETIHTLDLSVKRHKPDEEEEEQRNENGDNNGEVSVEATHQHLEMNQVTIKEEPRDYSSDQSMDSSESFEEDGDGNNEDSSSDMLRLQSGHIDNEPIALTNPSEDGPLALTNSPIALTNGPLALTNGPLSLTNGGPAEQDREPNQGNNNNNNNNGELGKPLSVCIPMKVNSLEERRKRNRTFIDPVTEVPRLEHWFNANTHPSHSQIVRFTQELNSMPYRYKFPKLEPKNIQFWFKNRRAKCKRLQLASFIHNDVEILIQSAIQTTNVI